MSGQDDDTEKPYDPTPKKLEDAREKGEVPRSTDLMTSASYGGFLIALGVFGVGSVERAGTALRTFLDRADTMAPLLVGDGSQLIAGAAMSAVGLALAPLMLLPAVAVVTSVIAMRAFTVTPSKLKPKASRISPLSNFKNKFGRNGLFEFAKSLTKLVVISICLGIFLRAQMPEMMTSLQLGAGPVTLLMGKMTMRFLFVVLIISLCIGSIDFFWQRAEHLRKHRMSHKEMTDETKQSEGDPHMKQQRRQRGYEIATNKMLSDVPNADVVIVNPTHYAIALKWSRSRGSAPTCVAKGVDEIAARIRERAQDSGVPVHSDPPTARALHASVEVGQEIDRDHYRAVAAAIRFADQMRKKGRL